MNQTTAHLQEIEALRTRLTKLSEASIRINESLEFDTVLKEVLDSARELTGARYSFLSLLDESGKLEDIVTSGLTPEESKKLWEMPDGISFFRFFSGLKSPLRVRDFQRHVKEMGLPEFRPPMQISKPMSFLGVPIRHRGQPVGRIYLADKEASQKFSMEDEETLLMFASQAALVIANARRYRDERRARADLEALIETSPVAVLVFNVATGELVSHNGEAQRIASYLDEPGKPMTDVLRASTIHRSDGHILGNEDVPLAEVMSSGEVVRVEEIVIQGPNGRNVSALMNATPIQAEDGRVESYVVTLQDMTPLQELERLRADFLGMVSHELRAPLTSIKGSAATLLESLPSLEPAETIQFVRIIEGQADQMRHLISELLDVARIETGTLSVSPEPNDVTSLVDEARNALLSGSGRDDLAIDIPSDLPLVLADRRRVEQVLSNLLSNAVRFSPASSVIRVSAVRKDFQVAISVIDDGQGVPEEMLPFLFRRSHQAEEDGRRKIQGAGLGLAICKGIVEAHGGRIWAESDGPGRGARFTFTLPIVEKVSSGTRPHSTRSPAVREQTPEETAPILVVDDDPRALMYVRDTLSDAGYKAIVTGDPDEVVRLVEREAPQLIVMDLILPGSDGIELMEDILVMSDVPVIFLSAYGRDEVIARAFEAGATDYVVKPFSPTELIARVRAAVRKWEIGHVNSDESYALGDLAIDYAKREVTLNGNQVQLTATEYKVLVELSANAGRVVTHEQVLRRVWGARRATGAGAVRTIIRRLRRKLGDSAASPTYIFNEPRVGYRIGHRQ